MDLLQRMRNGVNNFNDVAGPVPTSSGVGAGMIHQDGNPVAQTQIDLSVRPVFSQGVFNSILLTAGDEDAYGIVATQSMASLSADSLSDNLKTNLPVYLFGNSDFAAGFKRISDIAPATNWIFHEAKIVDSSAYNYDLGVFTALNLNPPVESIAVKNGIAKRGDLILTYKNIVLSGGGIIGGSVTITMAEIVVKCPQVAYGTLLDSVSSDTFKIGGFRYTVQDVTKIAQFDNEVLLVRQSMFGKLTTDSINPNSQKLPSNQQANIIDVPLIVGIDKNQILATYINYDVPQFTWSLFIPTVNKIKA